MRARVTKIPISNSIDKIQFDADSRFDMAYAFVIDRFDPDWLLDHEQQCNWSKSPMFDNKVYGTSSTLLDGSKWCDLISIEWRHDLDNDPITLLSCNNRRAVGMSINHLIFTEFDVNRI